MFGGTLYVPKSAIETYRNHPYWGKFASIRRIVDKLIPLVSEVSVSIKTGQTHEYLWDVMPIGNAKSEKSGTWSVGDSSIASIDHRGHLTGIAPGKTTVTFTICDTKGNRYTATSEVTVIYDPSGVEEIEGNEPVIPSVEEAVYDLQGRYLGSSTERLAPGIYVIRNSKGSRKVVVR